MEYSDENHILAMREILSKMKQIYDLEIDRRTVYDSVELLKNLNYDISDYNENKKGYYLRTRVFESSEIKLLTDAVCSFPFISEKYSQELVEKLLGFNSRYKRKKQSHLSVIRNGIKTINPQIFLNIEMFEEAIEEKKQVSFTYLSFNSKKELVPRREQPYVVNPYNMVYTNEHYYLVCNLKDYENISLYRIDRMINVEVLDELIMQKCTQENIKQALYAFTGNPEVVIFAFDKSQLNNVIDKFGTEIWLCEENDRYIAKIEATAIGMRIWALQYLPYVEILKPQWLREEIKEILKNNMYRGKSDE